MSPFAAVVGNATAGEGGQASVEYAMVTAAFLALLAGLAAIKELFADGTVVEHSLMAASHHTGAALGWIADVFSY